MRWVLYLNLLLLIAFPIAWFAPLMRAGILPLFGLSDISILSGIVALWEEDWFLALVVALFALLAPIAKTGFLALIHFKMVSDKALPFLQVLGKLAMADIFLVAIYISLIKGIGLGRIETAWGLYLFTFCIVTSLFVNLATSKEQTQ